MSYAIKVKNPGDKIYRFLTPQGGETRLRLHAAMIDSFEKADRNARYIADNEPGVQTKVVELWSGKTVVRA